MAEQAANRPKEFLHYLDQFPSVSFPNRQDLLDIRLQFKKLFLLKQKKAQQRIHSHSQ
jgi:hypothetical protein